MNKKSIEHIQAGKPQTHTQQHWAQRRRLYKWKERMDKIIIRSDLCLGFNTAQWIQIIRIERRKEMEIIKLMEEGGSEPTSWRRMTLGCLNSFNVPISLLI